MTNYLLEKYEALQFPVFPLMQMPKFNNFFKNITTSTYADEFAENHFSTMVGRYSAGAFVPSAGTGFVLSRDIIDAFGEGEILPSESITEDYRLSLTLFEKGVRMYYVLERVPRITDGGKLIDEFVATRSMFPKTFKTAVKQKARWILGITMQSFRFKDIFHIKGLRFAGRYSLYKDMKAKIGNLLIVLGYPVLIYFLASLFVQLPPIYPKGTFSWYLCLAVTGMMIERQLFRSVAIFNVYGMRSVFFACLLPPVLPIRLIWGNIINMSATMKAYRQKIFGTKTRREKGSAKKEAEKKKIAWDKTDHAFVEKQALRRYRRTIGDVLLEKGYVTTGQLMEALQNTRETQQTTGNYLMRKNIIGEAQLLDALAYIKHTQYVEESALESYSLNQFAAVFEEKQLRALKALPLLRTKSGYVFAFCDTSPQNAQTVLRNHYGFPIGAVLATRTLIEKGLDMIYTGAKNRCSDFPP
jgi:adsorption protein B